MLLPLAFDLGYENRIGYVCLLMVVIFESCFLLMIWAMKTVRLFAYGQVVCMFSHHSLFSDLSYENRQAVCMFFLTESCMFFL